MTTNSKTKTTSCSDGAEVWRDIPGYEGRYEASSFGNIRSVDNVVECVTRRTGTVFHKRITGRVKRPTTAKNGYLVVRLGHGETRYVHELVALTYIGERPPKTYICHGDGNRANNALDNLRYDSQSENERDKIRCGGKMKKLTRDDVLAIRAAISAGESRKTLAERYNVSTNTVGNIINGRCFAWL